MRKPTTEERLRSLLNSRTNSFTKQKLGKSAQVTEAWIACSWSDLKDHLCKQFVDGMSWENQGALWHIDHRISLFWAHSLAEVRALSHHLNLRPMWSWENVKRGIGRGPASHYGELNESDLNDPVLKLYSEARSRRIGLSSEECFDAMISFCGLAEQCSGKDFEQIKQRVSKIAVDHLRKILAGAVAYDCREQ